MGLFERIFNRKAQTVAPDSKFQTLTAYTPAFTTFNGCIYESELVRAAINAKAEHVSKMAVKVQGSAQPKLQTRLRKSPNDFQTWPQFLYRLMTIREIHNTGLIVPVLDEADDVKGIFPVLPENAEIVTVKGTPYLRYTFTGGKRAAVELDRVGLLPKFQYRSDFFGESNKALGPTMDLVSVQRQGIKEGVASAASFRFMAKMDNFTKADDIKKEQDRFNKNTMKSGGGGLLLWPNTYKDIQQIKSQPFVADAAQMQLIENNVFDYFGVNRAILQNSATAEQLDAFYNGALEPFAIQLGDVLTKMLFKDRERAEGAAVIISSDRLQYMSASSKLAMVQTMGDRGMLTINEGRHLMNLDPVPDGDKLMPIRGEYYNANGGEKNAAAE